jgi:hypothetical protein
VSAFFALPSHCFYLFFPGTTALYRLCTLSLLYRYISISLRVVLQMEEIIIVVFFARH